MKEDFLHYLWRYKQFDFLHLQTGEGEPIVIQDVGQHNTHAGPDFLNARIKIGETAWAGNVEIHIKSSDWLQHQHQLDTSYDNVILHVVYEDDTPIMRTTGSPIPCLSLKGKIKEGVVQNYSKLIHNEDLIPCNKQFLTVSELSRNLWLDRLLVERLEDKTAAIAERLAYNNNDWEETFYQLLARNFGIKVNTEPFEALALSLPLLVLAKHKNSLLQLEALLFGQAGMLQDEFDEDYPILLKKEYYFLQNKYKLQPILKASWKLLRLRPPNFPTIRIAQFARLVHQSSGLFSQIIEAKDAAAIHLLFEVKLSDYWLEHYVFDKISVKRNKTLGKKAIELIIINTIAPFLFYYSKIKGIPDLSEKALQLIESIPPEKNHIIEEWKRLGVKPSSAYQTQALLQLKNKYCNRKRCLECVIGNAILTAH